MTTQIITSFVERLAKIGVKITLIGNYPWIYLETINGERVKERLDGNHGFTVFWSPIRHGQGYRVNNITETFKLIRKYVKHS